MSKVLTIPELAAARDWRADGAVIVLAGPAAPGVPVSQYPPLPVPVLTAPQLAGAAARDRFDGAVIVLAAGCFDPLHLGHVEHLEAAKKLGNVLVVAVASDRIIREYKRKPGGPRRPFMPETVRAGIVASLRCVDAVVINDAACEVIYHLQPHVYVKGEEYRDNLTPDLKEELKLLTRLGGRLEFVSGQRVMSSTALLAGAVASAVPAAGV